MNSKQLRSILTKAKFQAYLERTEDVFCPRSIYRCPVATFLEHATRVRVTVGYSKVRIYGTEPKQGRCEVATPDWAKVFIISVDSAPYRAPTPTLTAAEALDLLFLSSKL